MDEIKEYVRNSPYVGDDGIYSLVTRWIAHNEKYFCQKFLIKIGRTNYE